MSGNLGCLQDIWRAIQAFFLRVIHWMFLKKNTEPDPESRVNLSTEIIYGEKLPVWTPEPPKSPSLTTKKLDAFADTWARQKAEFLRSPVLKRKGDFTHDAESWPRVRFSEFPVEYPRSPSELSSQDFSIPPIIRIEDWSTPPSPGAPPATAESLTLITTPFSGTDVSSPKRDSLTVPMHDSPGLLRNRVASRTRTMRRTTSVIGATQTQRSSLSEVDLTGTHQYKPGQNHGQVRQPGRTRSPNMSSSPSGPSSTPPLIRPARTSASVLSSSLLNLLDTTSFVPEDMGFGLAELQRRMTPRSSKPRPPRSSKRRSGPNRHHSQPLSTNMRNPVHDDTGPNGAYPSEMRNGRTDSEMNYYRHSVDIVGLPFPIGITLSSDVESETLTRFHEKGLAMTPEKSPNGFRRRLAHTAAPKVTQAPAIPFDDSPNTTHVPYPYVFDFDEYFKDLPSPRSPRICIESTSSGSDSSPCNNRHSFDTPTPAPRSSSSPNVGMIAGTPDLVHYKPGTLASGNKITTDVSPIYRTAAPARNPSRVSTASDTDEDESRGSEYSDQIDTGYALASSSGDLPLAEWVANKRKNAQGMASGTLSSDYYNAAVRNSTLSHASNEFKTEPQGVMNAHPEMMKIRESLRGHYTFTRRLRDPCEARDTNEDSFLSLVESYSSGSTLSHHYHPHQWRLKSGPSAYTAGDRKLDTLVETLLETGLSKPTDTSTPKVASRSTARNSYASDAGHRRSTPAWVLPPRRAERTSLQSIPWSRASKTGEDMIGSRAPVPRANVLGINSKPDSSARSGISSRGVKKPGPVGVQTRVRKTDGGGLIGVRLINARPTSRISESSSGRRTMPEKF